MRYPTVIVRSEVLSSWLTVSGYTRTQLASELEISKGRVSQLLSSAEEPSARLIGKLLTLTNLSFDRLFKVVHNDAQTTLRPLAARALAVANKQNLFTTENIAGFIKSWSRWIKFFQKLISETKMEIFLKVTQWERWNKKAQTQMHIIRIMN